VGFLHRRLDQADFYFISNISQQRQDLRAQFAVGKRKPQRWNPEDGTNDADLVFEYGDYLKGEIEFTEVQLRLEPFESRFIVFGKSQDEPVITRTNFWGPVRIERHGRQTVVNGRAEENGKYWFETPKGRRYPLIVKDLPEPIPLGGPWTLKLGDKPSIELVALRSWNELPEGKAFSGWAIYSTSFEFTEGRPGLEWMIDLGRVHETAEVELNGVSLGAAWKGTRRLECENALKVGENQLVVRVANLWIHHMKSLPPSHVRTVAETYGIRWGRYGEIDQKDLPPSGLLGPMRLIPLRRWTLKI